MFGFMRRSPPQSPSAAVRRAVEADGLPAGIASASALRIVQSRGRYSGRKVTFIRIFDPAAIAERAVNVRGFKDLDAHAALVLRTGHIEDDGTIIIASHPLDQAPRASTRTRAGRTVPDGGSPVTPDAVAPSEGRSTLGASS